VADGWAGTSFVPEAAEVLLEPIRAGAEAAGRSPGDLDLQAGGSLAFGDLDALVPNYRPGLAFPIGAMGSRQKNFYNAAFRRAGYEDACEEIQRLWLDGKRDEAIARVPDALVTQTTLLGDDDQVRGRIRAYRDAGITTLRLQPEGRSVDERLATLAHGLELVRQVDQEASPATGTAATTGARPSSPGR
jgi:alkanesulfonate monooxygenase SsuD/methylene tetrahydromethanopterin reductase-like flavin-dependent oxidoreductase (luciferase family)